MVWTLRSTALISVTSGAALCAGEHFRAKRSTSASNGWVPRVTRAKFQEIGGMLKGMRKESCPLC